jgi:hypothetical protein
VESRPSDHASGKIKRGLGPAGLSNDDENNSADKTQTRSKDKLLIEVQRSIISKGVSWARRVKEQVARNRTSSRKNAETDIERH